MSVTGALGVQSTGVVWLDAHADFNTPETSGSGFVDGMGLSILAGDCFAGLAKRFDGFAPLPLNQVIQIGVRDVDPDEEARLARTAVERIAPAALTQLPSSLRRLAQCVSRVYVHVDVDVLDVSEGRGNTYACPGGLSLDQLLRVLRLICERLPIAAGSITSYDPAADADGCIGRAIPRIVELIAAV